MTKLKHFVRDYQDRSDVKRKTTDAENAERLLSLCFTQQADFVTDPARRKSALCPRRSGKSFSCLVLMARTALLRPNSIIKYVCLTRGQAKANLWSTLKQFADQFELGLSYHETDIRATFPNGSTITFAGAETRQEIEKLRGQSYDLVVLDEAKSFQAEILQELIEQVVWPTLTDRRGTFAMIGTPGNILAGPFWETTTDYDPTDPTDRRRQKNRLYADRKSIKLKKGWWSFHRWHVKHNVAMPHIWQDALAQKESLGTPDLDPGWRREWLGEWCPTDSLMVYRYDREHNTYTGALPEGHSWQYLLGLDLGYNDSTAIVVAAFSDTHPNMYQVYEWKEPGLTVDQIERQVKKVQRLYPDLNAMIADTGGLGKTIVETLREHGYAFEPAEKRDKLDHIELVNSDLMAGRIKLLPDSHLAAEMQLLQWKDETYKKENKDTDNHLCDAFLYLIRHAYHYFWEAPVVAPTEGTPAWIREFEENELEQMLKGRDDSDDRNLDIDMLFDFASLDGTWIN